MEESKTTTSSTSSTLGSNKRRLSEDLSESNHNGNTPQSSRPKLGTAHNTVGGSHSGGSTKHMRLYEPGHTQIANDIYMDLVAEMMYPKPNKTPQAVSSSGSSSSGATTSTPQPLPKTLDRGTLLGYLNCPLRKPTVMEKWSPYEISMFEAVISLHGKNFHIIQQYIGSKTVKEVIEFYYDWKKTSHYTVWKKQYCPDERDFE